MTAISLSLMLLLTQVLSPGVQNRLSVSGLVIRAGTTEPLSDTEVTLNVAPPSAAFVSAVNSVAAQGMSQADLMANLIQLVLLRPQEFQLALNQLKSRGQPEIIRLMDEWQAAREMSAGFPRRTTTDSSGRFSLADVPPGQYWVIAKRDGFFEVSTGVRPPSDVASVPVNVAQSMSDITISMVPGALISGRVRDAAGRPQSNVNVQVFTISYQTNQPILQPVAAKTTDDRGEYRLFWLKPGEYFVAATPRQGAGGPTTTTQDVFVKSFYPNAADITKSIPVSVKIGDELGGIDIEIQAVAPLKVSGQVISALPAREPNGRGAVAAPAATLMLLRRDTSIPDDATARVVGTVGLSGSTGKFEVSGLLPGSYDLYARIMDPRGSAGPGGGGVFAWGRTPLDISNRDVEGLTIGVHASVDVNGVATTDGGPLPTTFSSVRVVLQPAGSTAKIPQYLGVANKVQTPKADGSFTVPAVAEGNYRVHVLGLPPNAYVADIRQNTTSVYDSGILIDDKTPEPLEILLSTNGGTVQGTVYTSEKKVAPFATVALVPSLEHRQNTELFKTVTADALGQFVISGIRPNDYKLLAWDNISSGASQNAGFVAKYEAQGSTVKVAAGSRITAEVLLLLQSPK